MRVSDLWEMCNNWGFNTVVQILNQNGVCLYDGRYREMDGRMLSLKVKGFCVYDENLLLIDVE